MFIHVWAYSRLVCEDTSQCSILRITLGIGLIIKSVMRLHTRFH